MQYGGVLRWSKRPGCGIVFQLKHKNSGWTLNPLYTFQLNDGALPLARVVFGPGGLLYGTTSLGGALTDCKLLNWLGCGVIFALQPPATACKSALCPWSQARLHLVGMQGDGNWTCRGDLVFDASNNAYTVNIGGVYQLTPSGKGWTATYLYNLYPQGGFYFQNPAGCVVVDAAGNLYGTGQSGPGAPGDGNGGGVYELTPSSPPWQLTYLYINTLGGVTQAGVVRDSAGNLYGTTNAGGQYGGGTVFEVSPSNGGWTSSILYNFSGSLGSYADLVLDAAGNLYGTTVQDGAYGQGNVFKLTPSNGQWIYTSLHDFTGGADGGAPYGQVTLDANGNLYGTATVGGANNKGVVWEMTP